MMILLPIVLSQIIGIASCIINDRQVQNAYKKEATISLSTLEYRFDHKNMGFPKTATVLSKDNQVYVTDSIDDFVEYMDKNPEDVVSPNPSVMLIYESPENDNRYFRLLHFYSSGKIKESYEGIGGNVFGKYNAWDDEGRVVFQSNIANGDMSRPPVDGEFSLSSSWVMNGDCQEYIYASSSIKSKRHYKLGKLHGESSWENASDIKVGDKVLASGCFCKEVFDEGNLAQGKYFTGTALESEVIDGIGTRTIPIRICGNSAILICSMNIEDGRENGLSTVRKLNIIDGSFILNAEVNFSNGNKSGKEVVFYENGNVFTSTYWMNNRVSGKFSIFYKNGSLMLSGGLETVKQNSIIYVGEQARYNKKGNKIASEYYSDNGILQHACYFDDAGEKVASVVNGVGKQFVFDEDRVIFVKELAKNK
ncbi:MAG: hypothetical protein KAH32_02395 [Chlamydiia bacterium]|nr:hypothetical protein [Chlamydiia bacterium]